MSDTHRFFVAPSDAVADAIRAALDRACNLPSDDGETLTAFLPAVDLPHDQQGRPIVVVDAALCSLPPVRAAIASAIAAGVVEVTRAEYESLTAWMLASRGL